MAGRRTAATAGPRICCVGGANTDLVVRLAAPLTPGATLAATDFRRAFGGKGANQAVMAARLGAAVTMVCRVGADDLGEAMLANLAGEGIDTRFVAVDRTRPSGVALILVDPGTGRNTIGWAPGATGALGPADVMAAAAAIHAADVLVCELEPPRAATEAAVRIARSATGRRPVVLLNAAPIGPEPPSPDLLRAVDVLVVNEDEAVWMAQTPDARSDDEPAVAARLARTWGLAAIVTLGAGGAVVAAPAGDPVQRPSPAVRVLDTTGAGDAFVGTLAVGLGRGLALVPAVDAALAVASFTVTRPGAQASYPSREEAAVLVRG